MTRPLPPWFDDAKFGIFVHWTAAAVPAFAPVGPSPFDIAEHEGWEAAFARTPYVEWYLNSLSIEGSPVAEYHAEHHPDTPYDAFVAEFLAGHAGWDPAAWARLFRAAGAKYVVLVTKHHDGVTLWPSEIPNPNKENWASPRDCVGDLAAAVRAEGMRFGTYYSGGLDWSFGGLPITDFGSMIGAIPQTDEYLAYADAHWRELIDRYQPSVLWNDIGYPSNADLGALHDYYLERVPDGVVNDRFKWAAPTDEVHSDFLTPEYSTVGPPDGRKWESTRGMGTSFGYNRMEDPADYLSVDDLVRMVIDVTAHGGNVLLNVGPMGDGRIPWTQAERLLALGAWLDTNSDAIYDTRPWTSAPADQCGPTDGTTADGRDVRFTWSPTDGSVFATVIGARPAGDTGNAVVTFEVPDHVGAAGANGTVVTRLGHGRPLVWERTDECLTVHLTDVPAGDPAFVLRIAPA